MKIKCPTCLREIEVDVKTLQKDRYIQCPICANIFENNYKNV